VGDCCELGRCDGVMSMCWESGQKWSDGYVKRMGTRFESLVKEARGRKENGWGQLKFFFLV
jgi:hypothetical protein